MTTQRKMRCEHCGTKYNYITSSYGFQPPHNNDDRLCPSCKDVIISALENIPTRYQCRYRNVTELSSFSNLSLEIVLKWEKQFKEECINENKILIRRIFVPLIDLESNDSQNVREIKGRDNYKGITFKVATWHKSSEFEICVPMEYDLLNNKWTDNLW